MIQKVCAQCGAAFETWKRPRKFCGMACSSASQRAKAPKRYRHKKVSGRHTLEHRYVVEQHLGRELRRGEVVHHINEDKTDNRIENLQVMTEREHGLLHNPPINPVTTDCSVCGETFTPHKTKRGRKQTCSQACRFEQMWRTRRAKAS